VDQQPNVTRQQKNWIGKSTGACVNFTLKDVEEKLRIYTTRPDTLFGVTFMVMAPEHPLLEKYAARIKNLADIEAYKEECTKKTEFERTQLVKEKTGVRVQGLSAINPVNGKEIPIYISDYVMMGYGTGAIMAVPAHDERDYDFAKKFGIDIIPVIEGGDVESGAYTGDGKMINSDFLNDYSNKKDSIARMIAYLEEKPIGEGGVQYKMKDWAFNRQRYWGEPIPIVHCEKCGMVAVPYEELPLKLPPMKDFRPGEGGESPLASLPDYVNCTCPKCGGAAKRETDTMPQWAGSSWYFLRYIDPKNTVALADKDKLNYWLPVDWYNGGMEHVTRHLIYSRFWHKFLYDIGVVPCDEPYAKRTAQGLILGPDGEKMSKSRGNVVDPNAVVDEFGADVLRLYILFMGDYEKSAPWSENSVKGCKRFLDRIAGLTEMIAGKGESEKLSSATHKTIKKVTSDIDSMKFNTAIAAMMSYVNEVYEAGSITRDELSSFVRLLCPFAPHLAEEIWSEVLGEDGFCAKAPWPTYDEAKTVDATVELAVQINGKLRATVRVPMNADKDTVKAAALAEERVSSQVEGKTVVKEILVPNKIYNIVVK
ncbi:MAG: leucine--tRNA ligase, partial [Clostridia bacterium]|nr:leucine--tRNA ligase [Clostridia bacterium]